MRTTGPHTSLEIYPVSKPSHYQLSSIPTNSFCLSDDPETLKKAAIILNKIKEKLEKGKIVFKFLYNNNINSFYVQWLSINIAHYVPCIYICICRLSEYCSKKNWL